MVGSGSTFVEYAPPAETPPDWVAFVSFSLDFNENLTRLIYDALYDAQRWKNEIEEIRK